MIVTLGILGLLSIIGGWSLHDDRIQRYDEADLQTQMGFRGDFAFSVSLSSFGLACLVSAWMAFRCRKLRADRWAGASQTGREILVGFGSFAIAGVLTMSAREDTSSLFTIIWSGLPAFLAVGAWMLIIGPGRSAYARSRSQTPTYLDLETLSFAATRTTVPILRPWMYASLLGVLIIVNCIAGVFFSNDREMRSGLFLLQISESDLLIATLVFLSILAGLFLVVLVRLRHAEAVDLAEVLSTVRPLIFVNVLILAVEWYNLFMVPVYDVTASLIAVAIVTALAPALLLSFSGPVLTETARIRRRAQMIGLTGDREVKAPVG